MGGSQRSVTSRTNALVTSYRTDGLMHGTLKLYKSTMPCPISDICSELIRSRPAWEPLLLVSSPDAIIRAMAGPPRTHSLFASTIASSRITQVSEHPAGPRIAGPRDDRVLCERCDAEMFRMHA